MPQRMVSLIFIAFLKTALSQQPNNGNPSFQFPMGPQGGRTFQMQGNTFQGVQGSVQPVVTGTQFQTVPASTRFQTQSNAGTQIQTVLQGNQLVSTSNSNRVPRGTTFQAAAGTAMQPFLQTMQPNGLQTINSFATTTGQESSAAIQNTLNTAQTIASTANSNSNNDSNADTSLNGNIVNLGGRIFIVTDDGRNIEAPNFAHLVGSVIRNGQISTTNNVIQPPIMSPRFNNAQFGQNRMMFPTAPPVTIGANGNTGFPGPQFPGNVPMNGQMPGQFPANKPNSNERSTVHQWSTSA